MNNRDNYPCLPSQTRNPVEVLNELEKKYYGEDHLPEMHDPENREEVNFNLFATDYDKAMRFKNSLACFPNVENHFFMLLFMA